MPIAREGYPFIAAIIIIAVIVHLSLGWEWALLLWVASIFIVQFFREPKVEVPTTPGAIVSPAYGRVVSVTQDINPYNGKLSHRIAIFLNVFSVHSNRIPITGVVTKREYAAGKFVNAALDKSAKENERNTLVIQSENSFEVVCIQIAGLIARRILCYVNEGDQVSKGDKYGFIRFGSRVEIYLPADCTIRAVIGDKVRGGSDLIGYMPQELTS